jgi:hypothetical protein
VRRLNYPGADPRRVATTRGEDKLDALGRAEELKKSLKAELMAGSLRVALALDEARA